MLAGHLLNLGRLGVDNLRRVGNLVVDEFLVGRVQERHEEGKARAEQCQAPVRDDLDQVVGHKGAKESLDAREPVSSHFRGRRLALSPAKRHTYGGRGKNVFSKQDALGLDDEEVDELMDVANNGVQRLLRHRVVPARPELRRESIAKDGLARNFSRNGDAEGHPSELETPSDNVEIANREDQGNGADERNGRRSCSREGRSAASFFAR